MSSKNLLDFFEKTESTSKVANEKNKDSSKDSMDETFDISTFLANFTFIDDQKFTSSKGGDSTSTIVEEMQIQDYNIKRYVNEYWTAKQRQASSIHEVSYRACFKPQLPKFFITLLSNQKDIIYDPFSGRGTTVIEAGLLNRNVILNDINPLSRILAKPRFFIPSLDEIRQRLMKIPFDYNNKADIDLSMFYHQKTEAELVSIRNYLQDRLERETEDGLDRWIRMVATNRLTGHSSGFFSVYTLPPNQAVSQESQVKINAKRNQIPDYRDTKKIILNKSKSLMRNITPVQKKYLRMIGKQAKFLVNDAKATPNIEDQSIQLTITSPPFLDIVQYSKDNWLRCWFNSIDEKEIAKKITMSKKLEQWNDVMRAVFKEFYRITKPGGWIAFEVGEVRKGKIRLDESIVPIGTEEGFQSKGILINLQEFTKTSNIWGINNNASGTNTNRIVIFQK